MSLEVELKGEPACCEIVTYPYNRIKARFPIYLYLHIQLLNLSYFLGLSVKDATSTV